MLRGVGKYWFLIQSVLIQGCGKVLVSDTVCAEGCGKVLVSDIVCAEGCG